MYGQSFYLPGSVGRAANNLCEAKLEHCKQVNNLNSQAPPC